MVNIRLLLSQGVVETGGNVQAGAFLGDVDVRSAEHGFDADDAFDLADGGDRRLRIIVAEILFEGYYETGKSICHYRHLTPTIAQNVKWCRPRGSNPHPTD